jgi:hypothetical protein
MNVGTLRRALALRIWIVLGLLSGLLILPAPWGPPTDANAAETRPEPAARLQLVIKEVTIHDDREGFGNGLGDLHLRARIWRCKKDGVGDDCLYQSENYTDPGLDGVMTGASIPFKASDGDTIRPDRLVPGPDDRSYDPETSYTRGFAVYDGFYYVLQFKIFEQDGDSLVDSLGPVSHAGDTGERGLGIGTFTKKSGIGSDAHVGDYTITYEIRPAPLPDLRTHSIKINALVGTTRKLVCMGVTNHEIYDADAFEAVLTIDGAVPPGGRASAGYLKGGTSGDLCVEVALPTSGQYKLGAIADASHLVTELNEANNLYETPYTPTPGKPVAPATSPTQAELTVGALKVNGQVPDGKDDCKAGKNTVSVQVKNQGTGGVGEVTVRLVVDGAQKDAAQQSVKALDAGQEREVTFQDIRLKAGQHALAATVDPGVAVAKTGEANNTLTVSARCTDGD